MRKFDNLPSMKNSTKEGSSFINHGRDRNRNSHRDGSVDSNKSLIPTVRNNFEYESIPPFIRSKIESTVQKAIQQKKIFALGHSSYRTVKDTLTARGWMQKTEYEENLLKTWKKPEDLEELYTQSLLRDAPVTILWTRLVSNWNTMDPTTLVNRFPLIKGRDHFCSKIGLNNNLQDAYWYHEDGVSAVKFPRTYNLEKTAEVISFIDDYLITACISLLKIVVKERIEPTHSYNLFKIGGKIPLDTIHYAIKKCDDYITFREHGDLDDKKNTRTVNPSIDSLLNMYDNYLTNYSKIVDQKGSFPIIAPLEMKNLYNRCRLILLSLPKFLPQIDSDGYYNLWIVKDSDLSCGKGVWVVRELSEVFEIGKNPEQENTSRYIVQKYIERPLLIYNTKFDIRQWFLLTRVDPLHIWMYRTCYLRFSSQPFSVDDTHEAVHLCNNSVQRKYTVNPKRHPGLPQNNMWDSTTFRKFLKNIGEEDKWAKVIYPGMRASIIAALQVSQEDLVDRPNSFELYGADFVLTEDFSPWLIEINSSPAMHASTNVTRTLCTQCFKDVMKVVLDDRKNQEANTGDFELIYKQCYFYKQINPKWYFSNIFTYGTQLKIAKNQSQKEPLPIMNALKMKKLKNILLDSTDLDVVPKTLLHQQRKNLKDTEQKASVNKLANESKTKLNTSTDEGKKQITDLDNRNTDNQSVGNLIKTFLRSSQKIKYMSLPKITTVDRTYFQVIEKNNTEAVSEQPEFDPELDVSMLRILSNNNLRELGINFIRMAVKADSKNNLLPLEDSKPQKTKSKEAVDKPKIMTPNNDLEEEPKKFELVYNDLQNESDFLPERSEFDHDSNKKELQSRIYREYNDIVLSNDSWETIISKDDMENYRNNHLNNENINLKRESKINYNIHQIEFNKRMENDECSNTTKFHSDFEEEIIDNILEDILRSNNNEHLVNPPAHNLEESSFYRSADDNKQMVLSNEIDKKYLLNIYLALKKENVDLYNTDNDRSFVEIESANNIINYIFFIQHKDVLEYGINNDNSLNVDNIPVMQEPEQIIVARQPIQESINDCNDNFVMNQLQEEDILTTVNGNPQILQTQECMMIQRHSNTKLYDSETNEFSDECHGKKHIEKRSSEKIFTKEEKNQIVPSSRSIHQNNRVLSLRRILSVGVLLSILIVFRLYCPFSTLVSSGLDYFNIGKI